MDDHRRVPVLSDLPFPAFLLLALRDQVLDRTGCTRDAISLGNLVHAGKRPGACLLDHLRPNRSIPDGDDRKRVVLQISSTDRSSEGFDFTPGRLDSAVSAFQLARGIL